MLLLLLLVLLLLLLLLLLLPLVQYQCLGTSEDDDDSDYHYLVLQRKAKRPELRAPQHRRCGIKVKAVCSLVQQSPMPQNPRPHPCPAGMHTPGWRSLVLCLPSLEGVPPVHIAESQLGQSFVGLTENCKKIP